MNPEVRWVLACVRSLDQGTAPPPPVEPLNWEAVLAIAEVEGLAPALGFACDGGISETMPGAVRERLRRRLADSTACHLVQLRELRRLLKGFRAAGVPVIPLKGPVLGEMLYPHPPLRPSSDLDLLIRPEARYAVDDLLQQFGCRRRPDAHSWAFDMAFDRATCYDSPSGVRIDLHWALLSEPRYVWNEAQSLEVWDRAILVSVADEDVLGLCPEDLLLYLALHLAVHHSFAGLLWYWDLSLCIGRWATTMDWQAVLARAGRWRVRAAFYFAMLQLGALLGARIPAAAMAEIEPWGPRAAVMGWLLRHRARSQRRPPEHLIALLLADRSRDVLGTLRRVVLPPAAWLEARYAGVGSSRLGRYRAHYGRLGQVIGQTAEGFGPPRSAR